MLTEEDLRQLAEIFRKMAAKVTWPNADLVDVYAAVAITLNKAASALEEEGLRLRPPRTPPQTAATPPPAESATPS